MTNQTISGSAPAARWLPRFKQMARAKWVAVALGAATVGILGSGCAVEPGGFGAAYYEPNYSGYYSDYGYNGGGYYGGDVFVGGGYYGGHHFSHDFHGGGHGGGGHGGGSHGGGGHGGGGGHR